jgi:phenylalanyl-tRNA synthetase beta chain
MNIPVNWLKEYVEFDVSPDELARALTFSGTEVTGIRTVGSVYGDILVGEIREIKPHPRADNLSLCLVDDGTSCRNVICGAPNISVGSKSPLALPGAVLPGGMQIREKQILGEQSRGMLCAEDELGISDNHAGIMLLPRDTPNGTTFSDLIGPPEAVLEIDVTWNRPDCLSVIGIAREVAALFRVDLQRPAADFAEKGPPVDQLTRVTVEDSAGCPRYIARVIQSLVPAPSPIWMQKRLIQCGIRPISNLVDITNYVLLECGQPLHAFDYSLLAGHEIVVRRARPGEELATLDGVQRDITTGMLMIADAERPVAVAGVMGGAGSEIVASTDTVLLESACFAPPDIKRTSTCLGLATESSRRFEKGVDIETVEWASRRATQLLIECAGGRAAAGSIDVFPDPPAGRRISCRFDRAARLLGMDVPPGEVVAILQSLQLPVVAEEARKCTIEVPPFRHDLEIEADLIEEVARLHGLDKVPEKLPAARINPGITDTRTRALQLCRSHLVGLGLTEVMNYSFVSAELLDLFGLGDAQQRIVLPNPVSSEHAVMRDSLIPQMVETLGRNLARQVQQAAFFELGRVFAGGKGGSSEADRLCLGLMGQAAAPAANRSVPLSREDVFLGMKGVVEALLAAQQLRDVRLAPCGASCFEAGWGVTIENRGSPCGVLGLLSPEIRANWRMGEHVAVADLALDTLLEHVADLPDLQPVPPYPGVRRDIALIVAEDVKHEDVLEIIAKNAPPELTHVELFDIFRNRGVGRARKSLAYTLVYRSLDRTLTDEDANALHAVIRDALKSELKAEIREG